jgi:hypothetical protein
MCFSDRYQMPEFVLQCQSGNLSRLIIVIIFSSWLIQNHGRGVMWALQRILLVLLARWSCFVHHDSRTEHHRYLHCCYPWWYWLGNYVIFYTSNCILINESALVECSVCELIAICYVYIRYFRFVSVLCVICEFKVFDFFFNIIYFNKVEGLGWDEEGGTMGSILV